jgi:hypothetical protein
MLDAFLKVADRFGVPTAILFLLGFLGVVFVRGPLMKFAEVVAQPIAQLLRAQIPHCPPRAP